jgi:hypothetical protein
MEQVINSITKADVLTSASHDHNTMLSDAVFRPMLFSTPMVKAHLNKTKNQTRRIVKLQPDQESYYITRFVDGVLTIDYNQGNENPNIKCPYSVGDTIWVRETVKRIKYGPYWMNDTTITPEYECKYIADNSSVYYGWLLDKSLFKSNKIIPSIFMRKYESRIWDKITNVRIERLQDISEHDAINEGIICEWLELTTTTFTAMDYLTGKMRIDFSAKESYRSLWILINGQKSWDDNPLVWVYDFDVSFERPDGFR